MTKRQLMFGNQAMAEGAIAAGVRFYGGYPITPATEIFEILALRLPQVGGKCIQMEDEIASIHACMGASMAGVKSITATSGPGFSLMLGGISDAAASEIPLVVINVQRTGPGAGDATNSATMDFMASQWGGNGDQQRIVIAPSTVEDAYWCVIRAVNYAERFRVPVIVLTEMFTGLMREVIDIPDPEEIELWERPRPTGNPDGYLPYDARTVGDTPPMADLGSDYKARYIYSYKAATLSHAPAGIDEKAWGSYSTGGRRSVASDFFVRRLMGKVLEHRAEITRTEPLYLDDADVVFVTFGAMARSAKEAVKLGRAAGHRLGMLRLETVWPFPDEEVRAAVSGARRVVVPEMSLGQFEREVRRAIAGIDVEVVPLQRVDTHFITYEQMLAAALPSTGVTV